VLPAPITQADADAQIAAAEAKIGELSGKVTELTLQQRVIDRKFDDAMGSAASQNRAFELTEPTSLGSNASQAKRLAAGMSIVLAAIAATVVATGWAEYRLRRKWRTSVQEPQEPVFAAIPAVSSERRSAPVPSEPEIEVDIPDWVSVDDGLDDEGDDGTEPAPTSRWLSPAERYRLRRGAPKSRYGGG
jgi:hypothetical protein